MWTRIKNATATAGMAVSALLTAGCYLCLGLAAIGFVAGRYDAAAYVLLEAAGLTLLVPADDDAGGDMRIEVQRNGVRCWIESSENGPLVSQFERFAQQA